MNQNKITNLIKFLCAILVIFSHSYPLSQNIVDPLYNFTQGLVDSGGVAVGIFFFFSGYYISKSIQKRGSEKFFQKRISRLMPSLIIVILFTTFILGPVLTNLSLLSYFRSKNTYLYLLNCIFIPVHSLPGVFTNNIYGATINGALWTLFVEVIAYVYLFILYKLKLLSKKRFPFVFFISILLCIVANKVFQILNILVLIAMIRPFLIFLSGVFIQNIEDKLHISKHRLLLSILFFILLLCTKNSIVIYIAMVFVLPYAIYSTIVLFKNSKISIGFLENISYQIYLVAFPIQQILVSLCGGRMNIFLNFVLSSFIAITLGCCLYKLEERILAFKFEKKS